jgi:hypothetical protein
VTFCTRCAPPSARFARRKLAPFPCLPGGTVLTKGAERLCLDGISAARSFPDGTLVVMEQSET